MRRIVGIILLVQESRFQLRDDAGVAHLFTLGANAAVEPAQLKALTNTRVEVQYTPARNMIGNIAQKMFFSEEKNQKTFANLGRG